MASVNTIEEARDRNGSTIGYPELGLVYHLLLSHLACDREEIIIEIGAKLGCTTIILAQVMIDADCKGKFFHRTGSEQYKNCKT